MVSVTELGLTTVGGLGPGEGGISPALPPDPGRFQINKCV